MRKPTPMHGRVIEALKAADLRVVNKETKVPISTMKKIKYMEIVNPGVRWIEILDEYFKCLRRRTA